MVDNIRHQFQNEDLPLTTFPQDAIFKGFDVLIDLSYLEYYDLMTECYPDGAPYPEVFLFDEAAVTELEGKSPLEPSYNAENVHFNDRVLPDNELNVDDSRNISGEKEHIRTDNGAGLENAESPSESILRNMADNPDLASEATEEESRLRDSEVSGGTFRDSEYAEQPSIIDQQTIGAASTLEVAHSFGCSVPWSPGADSELPLSQIMMAPQSLHSHGISPILPPLDPSVQQIAKGPSQPQDISPNSPSTPSRPNTGNTGCSQISSLPKKPKFMAARQSSAEPVKSKSRPSIMKDNGEYKMQLRVNHFDDFLRLNNRPPIPKVETKSTSSKNKSSKDNNSKEKSWFTERSSRIKALSDYDTMLFDAFIQKSLEALKRRSGGSGNQTSTADATINVDDEDDHDVMKDDHDVMKDVNIAPDYRSLQPKKRNREDYAEGVSERENMSGAGVSAPKRVRTEGRQMIESKDNEKSGLQGQQGGFMRPGGFANEYGGTDSQAAYQYYSSPDMGGPDLGISGLELPGYGGKEDLGSYENHSYNTILDDNGDYSDVGAFEEFPFERPAW